jgi:hypothetical protein
MYPQSERQKLSRGSLHRQADGRMAKHGQVQKVVRFGPSQQVEVYGKRQAQRSVDKDHTQSVDDAVAEDDITMAKIVVLEAEALKVVITDKKTSDQTEEAVHCLVCKQLVI